MKSINKIVSLLILSGLFLASCSTSKVQKVESPKAASQTAEASSLLWSISGNDIAPSYLFGTVHIMKKEDFNLKESTKSALMKAEQVVLEIDMDDPSMQAEMMENVAMKDGMTIDQLISEEDYKALDEKLRIIMGLGIDPFKSWQPLMLSSFLMMDVVGETPASFENSLMAMANKNSMEVIGLETITEQLNIFHEMPYKEQANMMLDYIHKPKETAEGFNKLIQLYLTEDVEALYNYTIAEAKKSNMDMSMLLDKRNKNWIPAIGELAKEKSSFIAVGAAHLGGPKGVINLLREAGYTVTAIPNK